MLFRMPDNRGRDDSFGGRGGLDYAHDRGRRDSRGAEYPTYPRDRTPGPIAPALPPREAAESLGHMMNFKSFVNSLREDLPPEMYKKRYDEYCIDFVHKFSNQGFHTAKTEEWFQNRYNPLNLHNIITEVCGWSASESAVVKEELLTHGAAAVADMRLDFASNPRLQGASNPPSTVSADSSENNGAKEDSNAESANQAEASEQKSKPADAAPSVAGRQIKGHSDRTIWFSSIPLNCTKMLFATHLNNILSQTLQPNELPERVLMSHPYWTFKERNVFEKYVSTQSDINPSHH
jgi:hypothetical protein